jgi:hypothetical protein
MSITDSPHQQVATLRVSLDTLGDISDSEGVAIARSVSVGALEEALDQAASEVDLSSRLSRDSFAVLRSELERRLDVREIKRGSLTVAIGIDESTVIWVVQQLWPGLADSALVAVVAVAFHLLRHGRSVAPKVLSKPKVPDPPSARIVRVTLEYEDGTRVTWETRRLRAAESKESTPRTTTIKYVRKPKRRGRRGKTKG